MKKLLSLLSVLTISSSAIPTTIAASPYQKKEELNNKINYLQINNSENLIINKRQENNFPENPLVFKISNSKKSIKDFFKKLTKHFINFLLENNIINIINYNNYFSELSNNIETIYCINTNNNFKNFKITVIVENDKEIDLIFNAKNFYLEGFTYKTKFYRFNDFKEVEIPGKTSVDLNFGSSYQGSNNLNAIESAPITWANIIQAFNDLANYGENPTNFNIKIIKSAIVRVILATSESLRFRTVSEKIIQNYNSDTQNSNWGWYFNTFLKNWDSTTKYALKYMDNFGTLIGFNETCFIRVFNSKLIYNSKFIVCNINSRLKRNINNNEYCYNDEEIKKPIYSETDYFKMVKNIINHNDLDVKLSKKTLVKIKNIFWLYKKEIFLEYLINLFKKVNNITEGEWTSGVILESDYKTLAEFIWHYFPYIKDKMDNLYEEKSLIIKTDRVSFWDNADGRIVEINN